MADRIPLIVDSSTNQVKELPAGDSIILADNEKLKVGTGGDLQISHDGSNSYIDEAGDGVLFIKSSAGVYLNGKTTDEPLARFIENGAVNLYHDNSLKFATTTTGISVTGALNTTDGATITGTLQAVGSANVTRVGPIAQASGAVQTWNVSTAANTYFVPSNNNTVINPGGTAVAGAIIQVEIAMGSSIYAIAWQNKYKFANDVTPTITATANRTDIFTFRYNGTVWQEIGRVQNLAQTV